MKNALIYLGLVCCCLSPFSSFAITEKDLQDLEEGKNRICGYSMHIYSVISALETEAQANNPNAFKILDILRRYPEKILLERGGYGDEYASIQYVEAWEMILSSEAKYPFLYSELDKDFPVVLSRVKQLKQEFPDAGWEYDLEMKYLLKALVYEHPQKAATVLDAMNDKRFIFEGKSSLYKAQHANPEFETDAILKYLLENTVVEGRHPIYDVRSFVDLFTCLANAKGVKEALPTLERARSIALDLTDEDCELQEALCLILKTEMSYKLPSAKSTWETLQTVVKEASYVDSDTTPVLEQAERYFAAAQKFNLPEIVMRVQSKKEAFAYVWQLVNRSEWYKEKGYTVAFPIDERFCHLYQNPDLLLDQDKGELERVFSEEIYSVDAFSKSLHSLEESRAAVEEALDKLALLCETWGFHLKDQYEIILTLYGPGGDYNPEKGSIRLFTTEKGNFKKANVSELIIHEMVHIGIEENIVQAYGLNHWEKERLVDLICSLYLFKDYQTQKPGDRRLDDFVDQVAIIEDLPLAIEKYTERYPRN